LLRVRPGFPKGSSGRFTPSKKRVMFSSKQKKVIIFVKGGKGKQFPLSRTKEKHYNGGHGGEGVEWTSFWGEEGGGGGKMFFIKKLNNKY